MLAEAITGRPIRGSWMADPEVFRVYELFKKVYKDQDVVALPLILGKDTLVDSSLGPAVERVAGDPERANLARAELPPLARRLLDEVEASGEVRMDRWTVSTARGRNARRRLERDLLVMSREMHTEHGYHTAVVMPWSRSRIAMRFGPPAGQLSYDDACDALVLAAVRSAMVAPEREVRRWFAFAQERIDALLGRGILARLMTGRVAWITQRTMGPARTSSRRAGLGR